jgi:FkbM family methyltransferase
MTWKQSARQMAAAIARTSFARGPLRRFAMRGFVPEPVRRRLPPADETFLIELPNGRTFNYTVEPNDPFVRQLYWRGANCDEAASLVEFASQASAGGLVVDVGAHTGLYTLAALASSPQTRVIAFEPVAVNVDLLRRNLELNGWSDRCDVRRAAVTNRSGLTEFHVPLDDHPMSGSLDTAGFRGLSGNVVQIEATTLDEAVGHAPVGLMKVDVEGYEDRVLEGARTVLERDRPTIVIECNVDGPLVAVESALRDHRYRFRLLDGSKRALVDDLVIDTSERFRNTLCVPEECQLSG